MRFYTGIFKNSRILEIARYPHAGEDIHGGKPGSVMTVAFELDGITFTALNGGPHFTFTEAFRCRSTARISRKSITTGRN